MHLNKLLKRNLLDRSSVSFIYGHNDSLIMFFVAEPVCSDTAFDQSAYVYEWCTIDKNIGFLCHSWDLYFLGWIFMQGFIIIFINCKPGYNDHFDKHWINYNTRIFHNIFKIPFFKTTLSGVIFQWPMMTVEYYKRTYNRGSSIMHLFFAASSSVVISGSGW